MDNKKAEIEDEKIIICTFPERKDHNFLDFFPKGEVKIINLPLIETKAINFKFPSPVEQYNRIIFTSKNAVEPFFNKAGKTSNKIAAIGKGTAEKLKECGYNPDFTGKGISTIYFLKELNKILPPDQKILLALGNLAPDTLQQNLSVKHFVERVNVYKTQRTKDIDLSVIKRINENKYDVILVSSPSAVNHLFSLISIKKLRLISIGETTTKTIKEYNNKPVATATVPGYSELTQAALTFLSKSKQ
ncbi:MAG: uroporphyrinogen-III synthase [Prolixibacteraceae bacterium]|nr:uroporphyrinogen-III synthase [Prolixibacteraceae bacterium]